jgi:RNA polymerase sigma-70 factor (ECF subfamily)
MGDVQDGVVEAPDTATLEGVYRAHGQRLLGAVLAFSGDREIAMDAVSEAFAQSLRRGQEIRSPLAWIWRASFRIAAGMLKARRLEDMAPRNEPYETPEPAWDVVSALRKLPEKQRAAVVLHYYADRPVKEVAAIIGSTSPGVKMHLNRARKRLRELLEEDRG